jgi:hypothetical protein
MPVLVTGIHVFLAGLSEQDVDDEKVLIPARLAFLFGHPTACS